VAIAHGRHERRGVKRRRGGAAPRGMGSGEGISPSPVGERYGGRQFLQFFISNGAFSRNLA